jgi:integrase
MKRTLTDASVKRLKPPASGQLDVFDRGYPGLALRLSYGGRRTWVYFCREGGRLKRHQLGTYPALSLADARKAWRTARERLDAGQPLKPPLPPRNGIADVVSDWLKRDQEGNASHSEVKRVMERDVLPVWEGRQIETIGRRDVLDVLDAICDRGRVGHARHVHAYVMRLMRWCVGRGIIERNPIEGLEKPGDAVARERKLSDAEIRALWFACKAIGWPFGPVMQLLLLTAARRSEIACLEWRELDSDKCCIRLAGSRVGVKNDEARTIPLCPLAWRILHDGPRIQDSRYVFTTTGNAPVSGWSRMKRELDDRMKLNEPWRRHDLRRTVATNLEAMGVPLQVTEAILGHTAGSKSGIVGVYQTHRYEAEKGAALAKWAGKVLSIVG